MQVFTSVLVLGIVFGAFIITDVRSYKQHEVDTMVNLAQVIGTNSISAIEFKDAAAATEMLKQLHNVAPSIVHTGILEPNGKLFASYSKSGSDTFVIPAALKEKSHVFTKGHLYINNPIVSENEVIGKVLMEVELVDLQQILHYKYELAGILLLVALVVAFLIAYVIQRYISNRLLHLVNTMKKVSKSGEYEKPISDEGKDEIATLIKVFNRLMQQIKENQRKKDEFIGIASHELKTPLTTIKGYIQLLNGMENDPSKKQFVKKALESVYKLERLVKDLLDVSKIQSGQLVLNMQDFKIDELLDETIAAVQMGSGTHKIIRQDHPNNHLIFADRQRIEQVLVNLLSNAIKYSPGENQVLVSCEKTEKELIIKIRDFGIGVPPDEQSDIFGRFYRTKDISVHISGFGLGLYICRDIINRHQGRIGMEPAIKGSLFYFSLPLKHSIQIQETKI